MIELPEATVLANQMQRIISNKKIIDVIKEQSPHKFAFFNTEIPLYQDILIDKTIQKIQSFGGYVTIIFDDYCLAFGEGTNIRYCTNESDLPKKHQLLLHFSDGTFLVVSVQMYGMLWLFKEGTFDNPYYQAALQKPSPLTESFSKEYFMMMLQNADPKLSVKAFLATEQRIPGLGNGVLQDILFTANIHPKRKIKSLTKTEQETIFSSIKKILQAMFEQGGRNTEKDLFGNLGNYSTILSNKTIKNPCPICQGTLIKQLYLGGTIYFCPTCQPEKK
jgi:formamidopyrimidine-DNA glycosylase